MQAHEQLMTREISRGVNFYGDSMMRDANHRRIDSAMACRSYIRAIATGAASVEKAAICKAE